MKFRSSLDKYRRGKSSATAKSPKLVTIDALSSDGDGVGRLDGQIVFVENTAPGDQVEVEIVTKKRRWLRGRVSTMIKASQDRVTPVCPVIDQCGGCTWQHLSYPTQLAAKEQQLKDSLERIGQLSDITTPPIVASDREYGYRNRIRGTVSKGQFHFNGRQSDQRIPIDQCAIAEPAINDMLADADSLIDHSGAIELAVVDGAAQVFQIDEQRSTALG